MKTNTIVLTHWVHQEVIDLLSPYGELLLNQTRDTLPDEVIMDRMRHAHAMMAFMPDRVDDAFLRQCPQLKVIGAALKGYDNFDVAACTRRGVWFTIVPDLLTIPTAELAIGLMLALARNIGPGDRWVRSGRFKGWQPLFYGSGLSGATVGILGMGRVGHTIARRLTGFDTDVIYFDPQPLGMDQAQALDACSASMAEVLARSDYLICAVPLNAQTRHLLNTRTIASMKPGSYLINIGRGSLVKESAVAAALDSGHLAGYAADVFEMEDWALKDRPLSIHPALIAQKDKTILTPHLGSAVDDIRKWIALEAARNIVQVLEGRTPMGALNRIDETATLKKEHVISPPQVP
jgi:phosphonate dehydrogenase